MITNLFRYQLKTKKNYTSDKFKFQNTNYFLETVKNKI